MSWSGFNPNPYGQGSTSNDPYGQQNPSSGQGNPQPVPAVQVVGATPGSSPVVGVTYPPTSMQGGYYLASTARPQLLQTGSSAFNLSNYTLTAIELFQHLPPPRPFAPSNLVYLSSTVNETFGDVGPISQWPLENIEIQYNNILGGNKIAHPPNHDPLKVLISEADAVHAAVNDYLMPVNIAFYELLRYYNICHEIFCRSEDTHHAKATVDMKEIIQVSRVDLSWGYSHPVSKEYVRFGILEFKKPGSLRYNDFDNDEQKVKGSGAKICRQLKKYCQAYGMPRAACCSYDTLVCLSFDGNTMHTWQGSMVYRDRKLPLPLDGLKGMV